MGRYLDNFKKKARDTKDITRNVSRKASQRVDRFTQERANKPERFNDGKIHEKREDMIGENFDDLEGFDDDEFSDEKDISDPYIDNIQVAQKPASFHHFILENRYKDLEKSIRGYKDVYNGKTGEWEIKRKKEHCFTDEESEQILRTVQSHLATDIKLTFYSKDTFGTRFLAVYEKIEFLFKRMMQYRFGRHGDAKKQGEMKEQALKIFVELITRIEANYLRAIQGMENKLTHQSVQSQESLQGRGDEMDENKRYT